MTSLRLRRALPRAEVRQSWCSTLTVCTPATPSTPSAQSGGHWLPRGSTLGVAAAGAVKANSAACQCSTLLRVADLDIITASTTSRPGESGIPSRAFTQSVS